MNNIYQYKPIIEQNWKIGRTRAWRIWLFT